MFFLANLKEAHSKDWISSSIKLWEAPVDQSVKVGVAATCRRTTEMIFTPSGLSDEYQEMMTVLTKIAL